ncbi:MAG: hypothetical protein EBU81_14405, partial [Proteobacteria bacterium]|nr:hypothetical protein [Pseudomonadota bacterium]
GSQAEAEAFLAGLPDPEIGYGDQGQLVLVADGKPHRFRVDRILPRLTRVECFGSPFTGSWVRIDVTSRRSMPFEISVQSATPQREETTP